MDIRVILDKCVGCTKCVKACPFGIISMREKKAVIGAGCTFCNACVEACKFEAIVIEGADAAAPVAGLDAYKGVWVFGEQIDGVVQGVVRELAGEGRLLADQLKTTLSVVLFGHNAAAAAEELCFYGVDTVCLVDDPALARFRSDVYSRLLTELIRKHKPAIVLTGATAIGRELIPRVAVEVHTGLTADCTGLHIDADGLLVQTRPAFGGNIMARIICPNHRPQMATVRHKVMKEAVRGPAKRGRVVTESFAAGKLASQLNFLESILEDQGHINLVEADIIVSGGRGIRGPENFALIRQLADVLGGAVGSSRAAVDAGWIPYRHQVGQTGKTVKPKIYVACGISGAIQHQVGMRSSDCIIAINKDPGAPIFGIAHYGIVADLFAFIPAFIKRLEAK
ncbi:MAG: electron transfer flavoprotein subunit alpha [Planctomycetota bacterium]